jgi:hypothetical protein
MIRFERSSRAISAEEPHSYLLPKAAHRSPAVFLLLAAKAVNNANTNTDFGQGNPADGARIEEGRNNASGGHAMLFQHKADRPLGAVLAGFVTFGLVAWVQSPKDMDPTWTGTLAAAVPPRVPPLPANYSLRPLR